MAAKRTNAARAKPRLKPEKAQPASPRQEIMRSQLELWRRLNTKEGTDVSEAAKEMAPIVTEHWAKILGELWRSSAMMQTSEEPLAIQEGLPKQVLTNYNEMLKRVFMTKSFGFVGVVLTFENNPEDCNSLTSLCSIMFEALLPQKGSVEQPVHFVPATCSP